MTRLVDALVVTAALVAGAAQAGASPLITLSNLQLGGELDLEVPDSGSEAGTSTTPAALSGAAAPGGSIGGAGFSLSVAVGSAGEAADRRADDSSALAYPVTSSISFGIAYELEDAEGMAAALIEDGMVEDDHLNHSLVVQTIWRFGIAD